MQDPRKAETSRLTPDYRSLIDAHSSANRSKHEDTTRIAQECFDGCKAQVPCPHALLFNSISVFHPLQRAFVLLSVSNSAHFTQALSVAPNRRLGYL